MQTTKRIRLIASMCLVALVFGLSLPASAQTSATSGQVFKPALKKWVNHPFISYSYGWVHGEFASVTPGLSLSMDTKASHNFMVGDNLRLCRFVYYQPELTFHIYPGPGSARTTFVGLTPAHFQLGVHLGLIRPFIGAGVGAVFCATARNADNEILPFAKAGDRFFWQYQWGGGLDFLSRFEVYFKACGWMQDFRSLHSQSFGEYRLGLAILI